MAGSRATTIDQTIQTEKASSSAGIETQRLRRAIAPALLGPEDRVLGAPVLEHARHLGPAGVVDRLPSPAVAGSWSSPRPARFRSIARIDRCIQASAMATSTNSSAKQEV